MQSDLNITDSDSKLPRLAIITTHPIQYNAPLFKLLAERGIIKIKVFYTWGESVLEQKYDPGFGKNVAWDIPLLAGYEYSFVKNIAKSPGSGHYRGIDNPYLINEIKLYDPTALLVFGWNFKSHLAVLKYFHNKIPILFRGDSTLLNETTGIIKILRTIFLKWVFHYVDFALYVGINNKNYFKRHGLKDKQLILAPHAIDNKRFTLLEEDYNGKSKSWKTALGIQKNELTVLYAGKLEDVKNPFFIIDLANSLQEFPVKFLIVGNGPLEAELKKRTVANRKVIYLDFQNQSLMPVVYRLGDVFILSSISETWGLGVNEAMACGCVIAVSEKVGGARDLVVENKNGIVFGISDIEKCKDFIADLVVNTEKKSAMKRASMELIQNFSFINIAVAIEKVVVDQPSFEKNLAN